MKKIGILPTLLTLGNGVCGFAAVVSAANIARGGDVDRYFSLSGWLIVAAMIFDALDGYVARLTKTASKFGGELDSLCDAISFGVAPAFLLLQLGPGWDAHPYMAQVVVLIAVLYMVCAILRLARFNVTSNTPDPAAHKRFQGLPSPGAAGCLASLAILRGELPKKLPLYWPEADPLLLASNIQRIVESWSLIGAACVALLMVSTVPYPHVTKSILKGKRHFGHLMQLILAAFVLLLMQEMALVLLFWVYALLMPLNFALGRRFRRKPLVTPRLEEGLPR